jgi:hypothetical protein
VNVANCRFVRNASTAMVVPEPNRIMLAVLGLAGFAAWGSPRRKRPNA